MLNKHHLNFKKLRKCIKNHHAANISMPMNKNYKENIVISKQNFDKCHTTKKSRGLGLAGNRSAGSTTQSSLETSQLCQEKALPASSREGKNSSFVKICSLCLVSRCRVQLSGIALIYCENISNIPI